MITINYHVLEILKTINNTSIWFNMRFHSEFLQRVFHYHCSFWQAFGTIVVATNERNSEWRAANADRFYVLISALIQLRHPVQSLRLFGGVFIATWIIYTFPPFVRSLSFIIAFTIRVIRVTSMWNSIMFHRFDPHLHRRFVLTQFHISHVIKAILFYQAHC